MKFTESDKGKCRQPREWGYPPRDTAEWEAYAEVRGSQRMNDTDTTNTSQQKGGLLKQILSNKNMQHTYKRVARKRGGFFTISLRERGWVGWGNQKRSYLREPKKT